MSLTLATVTDALIEFILSLLRDPEVAAQFEQDPDGVLAERGLSHISPADVQCVAPVIIERTQVVQVPVMMRPAQQHSQQSQQGHGSNNNHNHNPQQVEHHSNPVVREIQQVSNNFAWVDDRDTIVDQSVNQNIWAEGDVTQTFDNEAVVASGDESLAAAGDIAIDKTTDQSTTIIAGEDANVGNDTDVTVIDGSYNEATDTDTTTDGSTDVVIDDSLNDDSTDVVIDGSNNDGSSQVIIDDSNNEQMDVAATTDVDSTVTVIDGADDVVIDDSTAQAGAADTTAEQPADEASAPEPAYTDSAAEYTELESDTDTDDAAFAPTEAAIDEGQADENF